jgi:uncharacterized protein
MMSVSTVLRRRRWLGLSVSCVLAAGVIAAAAAQEPGAGRAGGQSPASPGQPRIKALLVSGGCCHDYTGQNKVLIDTVRRVLPVDWMVSYQGGNGGAAMIPLYADPDWYKGFDVIVHNECYTDVSDPAYIRRITAAHRAGVPAIILHCSLHSYRAAKVDDWREMMGATSFTHPEEDAPVTVKMTRQDDPIIKGLPLEWTTPIDELYVIEKFWPGARSLATAISPEPGHAEFPVVWTNDYHGARIFATSLGHAATWNEPIFQELLARGFQWVLRKDVTPLPPPTGRRGGR